MIFRIFDRFSYNDAEINVRCSNANLSHGSNILVMNFETDELARDTEEILKRNNFKTKHNESQITILNISDYELSFI
jgi:hypothetical protein